MRTMRVRTKSKMFDTYVTYLTVASQGKDGQLGERATRVKIITRVRQHQSQTRSVFEESNVTVPIGGLVIRDHCT